MLTIFLSLQLLTNGIVQITIPPTNPSHVYVIATSTDMVNWNDFDSEMFFGSTNTLYYVNTISAPQQFFRLEDLDELTL